MAAKAQGTWVSQDIKLGFGNFAQVDSSARFPLGTKCHARDVGSTAYGVAEMMYVQGTDSVTVAAGSVVTIGDSWKLTLTAARDIGQVGLGLSDLTSAATYGWVQIRGTGVAKSDTVSANLPCYIDGTAGRVDDAAVAGDAIAGMRTVSASDTNTCVVNMTTYCTVGDFDNA